MPKMTSFDAWLYAASWGSFMTAGDPGACMYGFSEDCRPQSEEHRTACIRWIDEQCLPLVRDHPDRPEYEEDEEEKLLALREYLQDALLGADEPTPAHPGRGRHMEQMLDYLRHMGD